MNRKIDLPRIEKAVREILLAIGEDPHREGLRNTPKRVASYYGEVLQGQFEDPEKILSVYYEQEKYDEMVLVRNIPFYSMCEHHLLPFFGRVSIAYIPHRKRLLGISKLARIVDTYSKRLQLQERITKHIADSIMQVAKPLGALVVIEAEHLCISMRGVKKSGNSVVTSAVRGLFRKDAKTRQEALTLINSR